MGANSCKHPPLETFGCLAYNVFEHNLVSRAFPLKVGTGKREKPWEMGGFGQYVTAINAAGTRSLHKHCILSRSILYFFWHCLFLVMITSGLYARLGERQKNLS